MLRVLFVLVLVAVLPMSAAWAGTDEGVEAFKTAKYETAYREFSAAAKRGDGLAHYFLGRMYAAGLGIEKSESKAVDHFMQSAEAGNADGAHEYGSALVSGTGVKQDFERGLMWLFVAEQAGLQKAKVYLDRFLRAVPHQTVIKARVEARIWHRAFNEKKKSAPN